MNEAVISCCKAFNNLYQKRIVFPPIETQSEVLVAPLFSKSPTETPAFIIEFSASFKFKLYHCLRFLIMVSRVYQRSTIRLSVGQPVKYHILPLTIIYDSLFHVFPSR